VPVTAPQVAEPQLLSAVHFPPQLLQEIFCGLSALTVETLVTTTAVTTSNPKINAIIHSFILTPPGF
jgi:hypothetical protein